MGAFRSALISPVNVAISYLLSTNVSMFGLALEFYPDAGFCRLCVLKALFLAKMHLCEEQKLTVTCFTKKLSGNIRVNAIFLAS